jgi:hypothetical protein
MAGSHIGLARRMAKGGLAVYYTCANAIGRHSLGSDGSSALQKEWAEAERRGAPFFDPGGFSGPAQCLQRYTVTLKALHFFGNHYTVFQRSDAVKIPYPLR